MLEDKCGFCGSDYWSSDGENNPVFWKDTNASEIHIKCYMYIEDHRKEKKVKVYTYKRFLDIYNWEKMDITPDDLRLRMGLTKEDIK
jgi:hypothetical protein